MDAPRQGAGGEAMSGATFAVRKTCRICGSTDLVLLIDYGFMPLAGGFADSADSSAFAVFPLRLFRCPRCTLMQVLDVVNPDMVFRNYSYASSTTQTLRDHFAGMGPEIVERSGAKGKLAVEFGCNDGVLMRPLLAAGANALGVDPSDVAFHASQEHGWPLISAYFTEGLACQIASKYGRAQLITGNNVFAHVDDVHAIVRGIAALLSQEGHFVFEVHYQGDLISLLQYDTVYHEHLSYYSIRSLAELFHPYGLRIADVQRIPIHSGSIRVTVAREQSTIAASPAVERMIEEEQDWDVWKFTRQVETRRARLRRLVLDLKSAGRRIAAYGAAGRVTILLNYCGLGPDLIDYVVDASPLRYGRYVPGVGIPIVPPERFRESPPDYAILAAWNYEAEIVAREQNFLSEGGVFIVPLPDVRLVGAESLAAVCGD
jgi:SAM-dependent methyltransferase